MSTAAIYARKSSESEDRQILSIDSQVRELKQFARRLGLTNVRVFIESKSAKSPGRVVFNDIVALVQKGSIDTVICWKLDRLARNPVDGGAVIWAMEESKLVNIHTPQRSFTNTGNDKFWMQLEFGMAKKYVDDLSDNVKRGIRAKLEQGWLPGLAPLGYVNDRGFRIVVKDPERFLLVRRMWDMMLSGRYAPPQIRAIASSEWGLRTRPFKRLGGKALAHSAIYRLFMNPFYYGALVHKGEYHQGKHPPMITKSEFDRVQHLLGVGSHPRPRLHTFAFTGLMNCGECGAAITAEHKVNRYGHKYVYYRCTRHKRGTPCRQQGIEVRDLEKQVASFLDKITITARARDWAIQRILDMQAEEQAKGAVALGLARSRYSACKREISELVNMRIRNLISDSDYLTKKRELEEESAGLLEALKTDTKNLGNVIVRCSETFQFANRANRLFRSGSFDSKRSILKYLGSHLTLKNKILNITPQKPLLLIASAMESIRVQPHAFAPQDLCSVERQKRPADMESSIWSGLSDLIRTYYRENPNAPSFKQILGETKKWTQDRMEQFVRRKGTSRKRTSASVPKLPLPTTAQ